MVVSKMLEEHPEFKQRFKIEKRELTPEEIKEVSLSILDEVHRFCEEKDIKYSLAYGTLIGAVRHKGFIPWDDDIDIIMLRQDYDKFISMFSHNENSLFMVQAPETDRSFPYTDAKVFCNATVNDELDSKEYGLAIDLFPIDKIPTNEKESRNLLGRMERYRTFFILKAMKWRKGRGFFKNIFVLLMKFLLCFIPRSIMHNQMHKNASKYDNLFDDYYLGCLYADYGVKNIMKKEVFNEFILLPFENKQYYCLKKYDIYLKNLYGNYMQLPPVEKQVSHHDNTINWRV